VDWKIFVISFVMYNVGWWMNELVRYIRNKPKRKKKNYVFLVTVCCQGNPREYEYKTLLSALIGYAKEYLKYSKYGTMNFSLKQRFK